ncbi:distal tail protein Dit [Bacillus subtilis]|uniref:distal tail protein Dit n=1 Tax=Bacillus subtilis TaxID=1423 RepID=UPI0021C7BCC2|nr:distal tail protein Dit [Bacillus subtilis]
MNEVTFNFCGFNSNTDLDLIVNDIKRNVGPEISENVQDVPGMMGKIFQGNSYGQRVFEIDVTIKATSEADRVDKIQRLSNLITITGDGEYPMVFSDDAEYTYYGHFSQISQVSRLSQSSFDGTLTLTFSCSDPRGYGQYISQDITENPETITPQGNSVTYPIFTCIPKKDVTKIAISDEDDNYVYIGQDVDPDTGDSPIDKEPRVLKDPCNTLATWTEITSSNLTFYIENGVPGGTMTSSPNVLKPSSFGSKVEGKWHGPVRQQWLPASYKDFRVRARMKIVSYYPRAMGKIEVYLLDSNGKRIGKLMLKDLGSTGEITMAQVQVGYDSNGVHHEIYASNGSVKKKKKTTKTIKVKNGTKKVKVKGKTVTQQQWKTIKLDVDNSTSTFTDFYGYLQMTKIGNKYTAEIMKLDENCNPAWSKPIKKTWTDTKNTFGDALAGVAFYTAKYDIKEDKVDPAVSYKNDYLALCDIEVWNIIDGGNSSSSKPAVIARAGDEIKINSEDRTVYKNGDLFMENFYIGSKFFDMDGGVPKSFAFEPNLDDAEWYMEYTPTTL